MDCPICGVELDKAQAKECLADHFNNKMPRQRHISDLEAYEKLLKVVKAKKNDT